jgi:hypothetical protein
VLKEFEIGFVEIAVFSSQAASMELKLHFFDPHELC